MIELLQKLFQPILNRFCPLIQHFQFLPRMSHISGAFIWHQMKKLNPLTKGVNKDDRIGVPQN